MTLRKADFVFCSELLKIDVFPTNFSVSSAVFRRNLSRGLDEDTSRKTDGQTYSSHNSFFFLLRKESLIHLNVLNFSQRPDVFNHPQCSKQMMKLHSSQDAGYHVDVL
jgi:hypothetical protein